MALNDQVALVTGGGRGIGRAVAQALDAAGAKVAVLARSAHELAETVRLIQRNGGRAWSFPGDVTVAKAVRGAVPAVEEELGAGGASGQQRRRPQTVWPDVGNQHLSRSGESRQGKKAP